MSLFAALENRAISWGWNKFAVNAVRHWQTTICGVGAIASALGVSCKYVAQLATTGEAPTVEHLEQLAGLFIAGAGLVAAKSSGVHDVALDAKGNPIPRAEVVQ